MTSEGPTIQFDPRVVGDLENDAPTDASSMRDSTASLSSSIRDYRTIYGRTFQTSNTTDYWEPNDKKHIEGFDITHQYTLMLMDDKLFSAPIEKGPLKILDIGTGTGIWAIDVADEFPDAEVIGTDISPVQPSWIPPNCSFQIDDAQLDWTFKKNHFDVIHARCLFGGIDDWQRLYDQAFAHLKPGGWFESMEMDIMTRSQNPAVENDLDHIFRKWAPLFWEAGDITGRTFRIANDDGPGPFLMETYMKNAGFVDIVHKKWKVPIGGWPQDPKLKQIGFYGGFFVDQSLEGWAVMPIGEILGWTFEEVTELVEALRKKLQDPKSLPYFNFHMVYGRKPELDKTETVTSERI